MSSIDSPCRACSEIPKAQPNKRTNSSVIPLCRKLSQFNIALQSCKEQELKLRSVFRQLQNWQIRMRQKDYQNQLQTHPRISDESIKIRRMINQAQEMSLTLWDEIQQCQDEMRDLEKLIRYEQIKLRDIYEVTIIRY